MEGNGHAVASKVVDNSYKVRRVLRDGGWYRASGMAAKTGLSPELSAEILRTLANQGLAIEDDGLYSIKPPTAADDDKPDHC